MDLLEIELQIREIRNDRIVIQEEYDKKMKSLQERERYYSRMKELALNNSDLEKIQIAERVLVFSRGFKQFDYQTVRRAIHDIVTGENELRTNYFGIKDYEHFRGQSVTCRYNMGPRHGYVVFSVGMRVHHRDLTNEEKNACLYYLNSLISDEKFRENAKGA